MVAAVAIAGLFDFLGLALEIRAGQIVEQHVQFGAKEILPAALEMFEKFVAVLEEPIQNAIQLVLAPPNKLLTQQIPHRAALRSEEHTSELQSLRHPVCRLLLEKIKSCREEPNSATWTRFSIPASARPGKKEQRFFLIFGRPPRSSFFPSGALFR